MIHIQDPPKVFGRSACNILKRSLWLWWLRWGRGSLLIGPADDRMSYSSEDGAIVWHCPLSAAYRRTIDWSLMIAPLSLVHHSRSALPSNTNVIMTNMIVLFVVNLNVIVIFFVININDIIIVISSSLMSSSELWSALAIMLRAMELVGQSASTLFRRTEDNCH